MKYQIGNFEFDAETNVLNLDGVLTPLENRAARVLEYFCENPGRLISRDELLDKVWGRHAISDHSVSIVISALRKALGDSAKDSVIIKTVAKKGYVFIPPESSKENPHPWKNYKMGLGLSALLMVLFAGFLFWSKTHNPETVIFYDLEASGESSEGKYLAEYLSESLLVELSKIQNLRVIRIRPPETLDQNTFGLMERLTTKEPAILRGAISKTNDHFRLTMRLEQGPPQEVTWGFEEEMVEDYYYLSGRRAIQSLATKMDWATSFVSPAVNERAERLFWRAVYLWESRTGHDTRASHDALIEALEMDPNFARAHAQLATIYAHKTGPYLGFSSPNLFDQAEFHLAEVEKSGTQLPEINATKALIAFYRDRNFDMALKFLNKGLEEWPNQALLWHTRGMVTSAMGLHDESIYSVEQALALDPLSHSINWDRVWFLYLAEKYEEALEVAKKTSEISDDVHYYYLALIQEALGLRAEAFNSWLSMVREVGIPNSLEPLEHGAEVSPDLYRNLLDAVEADGRRFYPDAVKIFWAHLSGDREKTFHLLETIPIEQENWVFYWLPEIPLLQDLKGDERFTALYPKRN